MAFWKRRSGQFEPVAPRTRYTVTYLGREEMADKIGLDNTMKPVDTLYRNFKLKKAKAPSKMAIEIVNNGIRIEPMDSSVRTMFANSPYFVAEGPYGNVFFPINKLSFGAADPFHSKVFCFVSRNEDPAQDGHWDCHAVVCESSAMAKNLTLYLVKAFQRIGDSKNDPIRAAQKSKKATTVHVLQERGSLEHQRASKKRGKRPPVSTVKVTLNVEGSYEQISCKQLDNNRQIADILAKQRSLDNSDLGEKVVVTSGIGDKDNGNTNVGRVSSSSDKENDVMDVVEETDNSGGSPREIVVTVAVNPELTPPVNVRPTSPRGASSSGEEDDGNTSPQEMITTMSPPDTPGYLSKLSEEEPKSSSPTHAEDISADAAVRQSASFTPSTKNSPPSTNPNNNLVSTKKDPSPQTLPTDTDISSQTKTVEKEVETEQVETPPTKTTLKDSPTSMEGVAGVLKRDSPSPPNTPSSLSSQTSKQETVDVDVKAAEKKIKREKRKSVRFAVDDELIE